MVMRLFPQLSGVHLFFETDDGMIHDLGDPKRGIPMSASATTRFPSRCAYIGFADVDNHVLLFDIILTSGCCLWTYNEWETLCK
jgi:hypothetical protein